MKRVLMILLAVVILVSSAVPAVNASSANNKDKNQVKWQKELKFKDVKGHWAENILLEMNAKGYVQGYQDASFKPSNVVSELEAVVMIVRALGLEEEAQAAELSQAVKHAKQIPSWATGYIQVAFEQGILTEKDLKSFKPNQGAKRIKVAQMIARALKLTEGQKNLVSLKFLDKKDIPEDFNGIVIIMVQTGIMQGNTGNCFLPNKPITRAEMAILLDRIDGKVTGNEDSEATGKIESVDEDEITIEKNGVSKEYDFFDDVAVYLNGKAADVEDLEEGMRVKLIFDEGKVIFVKAQETDEEDFKGEISQLVLGSGAQLTIETGSKAKSFKVNSDTKIEMNEKEIFLTDLEIGWTVTVEAEEGIALEIIVNDEDENDGEDDEDTEEEYEGIITDVDTDDDATISIKDEDGKIHTFDVDEDAEITLDGSSEDLADLEEGFAVEIEVVNDKAVKIEAESLEGEFEGEIVTITLVGQKTIIIETDDDEEYVFDITDDTEIEINGESADLDDLQIGDEVEIVAERGEALKVDAERDED